MVQGTQEQSKGRDHSWGFGSAPCLWCHLRGSTVPLLLLITFVWLGGYGGGGTGELGINVIAVMKEWNTESSALILQMEKLTYPKSLSE